MKKKKDEKKRLQISILIKMLLGICLPVMIIFIISSFVIINTTEKPVSGLTDDVLTAKSQTASSQVGAYFSRYMEVARQMATNSEIEDLLNKTTKNHKVTDMDGYDKIFKTLTNVKNSDTENIVVSWIADFDSSQFAQSDGCTSDSTYDITSRQWYKDVTAANTTIVTTPYVDTASGKLIVSAVSPVYDSASNKMIGITGVDFSIDQLQSMMKSYSLGESGFFMLVSSDGVMIYYPDSTYLDKNAADTDMSDNIKSAISNNQSGAITYTALGQTMHGYLSKDENTGYMVISGLPDSEYTETINSVQASIESIFIVALAVLSVLIILISLSISRPVKKLKNVANAIADGRLDMEFRVRSHDEIGQVSAAFGRTVERLRNYINYIDEVAAVLNQIASGDLVFELKYDYAGEFEKIKTSMLKIQATLSETVHQITTAADQVASGSGLVSNSSMALSQGATEQASAIEQLTASIDEISSQTNQNAQTAEKVNEITRIARDNASSGNNHMKSMLAAMEDINESSGKISKIIKVIDDIAFQTNILALNAAVEAARAGQHGKGFAVVAEEVRNLAAKSANAASETTNLIENSISKVDTGTKIANDTADALNKIATDVANAADLADLIATASHEQAAGIEQINQGISQVSQVVQTNAATAEESAAASEELSAQAEQLKQMVGMFKIKKSTSFKKELDKNESAESSASPQISKKDPAPKITLTDGDFGKY